MKLSSDGEGSGGTSKRNDLFRASFGAGKVANTIRTVALLAMLFLPLAGRAEESAEESSGTGQASIEQNAVGPVLPEPVGESGTETQTIPASSATEFEPDAVLFEEPPPEAVPPLDAPREPGPVIPHPRQDPDPLLEPVPLFEFTEEQPVAVGDSMRFLKRYRTNLALDSGDVILGHLNRLQGFLGRPFPATSFRSAPKYRFGGADLNGHIGIGMGALKGERSGEDSEDLSGFLFGGIDIVKRNRTLSSLAFSYRFGLTITDSSGEDGGGFGGSGDPLTLDQELAFSAEGTLPGLRRVRLGTEVALATFSGISRDIGGESDRTLLTATFRAGYEYSKKTLIEWDISVPIREFDSGVSTRALASTLVVHNHITRKTRLSLGYTAGKLYVESGSDQIFHQPFLGFRSDIGTSLSLEGFAGLDFRDSGDSTPAFIYDVDLVWSPWGNTDFSISSQRRVFRSAAFEDTNYITTSIALGVRHSFGRKLTGSLTIAYENADYEAVDGDDRGGRSDDLFQVSGELTYAITDRWKWTLTAAYGENESNYAPFSYRQITLQTMYEF